FDKATADDYDAVVLPGGVVNGDAIRLLPQAQAFKFYIFLVKSFWSPLVLIFSCIYLFIFSDFWDLG
ncbi:MAG: Intracellular protease, partial [uncultured Paraburkholderia sp.]